MKPITRILLVLIITFVFCQLIFVLFQKGAQKYGRHKTERLHEILQNNSYYDLIFIGSSIVHSNIHPGIIDSICNVSSYNTGVEGGNLLEFKMIFDAYLQNHPPPKFVMLTLDFASFNLDRKFFNHLDYYPHLSNKVVDRVLSNNGHQTALLKIFPFLELTEYDEEMRSRCVKGLFGKNDVMPGQIEYKGFMSSAVRFISDDPKFKNNAIDGKISDGSLQLFQAIRDTCKARNIELIINFPPIYRREENRSIISSGKIYQMTRSLATENKIHFLDDDKYSFCTDSSLYSDVTHLNTDGALLYSAILAKELSGIIGNPESTRIPEASLQSKP